MEEEDAPIFTKPCLVEQQYINTRFQANPTNRGKSCSHFFIKFILIGFFLSLLPLFPSEPPGFISNTVSDTTWELIHLLIIGIALSYGLFCRRKTPQTQTKPQISQPYAPGILQHSSLFDYEEGNSAGVSDNAAIPTRSFNLSRYRTEPFVVSKRENSKNIDDRPLGLPVRSLRSRVVSDSEEEAEEVCGSEYNSDSNGSNSSSTSEEDGTNLEGNVSNFTPNLEKQQSMRDFSMAKNGKFDEKVSKFESLRIPVPAEKSCQKFSGFCSWLPESHSLGREDCWNENHFYMPFPNYNQVNDYNTAGISPNLQNAASYYMPPAAVNTSIPFSASGFASNSRNYSHGNQHWGNANFENANVSADSSGVFMPSTTVPHSMPVLRSDYASRPRRYNPERKDWSKSPDLQNGTMGAVSHNLFMPSVASSPSMPAFTDNSASSVKTSEKTKFNHVPSVNKNVEKRSENHNVASGREKTDIFMPPVAISPSVPTFADDSASSVKTSEKPKFDHVPSLKKKDDIRSENHNVALGRVKTDAFMPPADNLPSEPTFANGSALSVRASKNSRFKHVPSLKKKDDPRSESNNVALGRENTGISMPSISVFADNYASFLKASNNAEFTHVSSHKKTDEIRSENNVTLGEQMPSAALSPSMPVSADDFTSSVKASKQNTEFNHASSLNKKNATRSECTNMTMGGQEANIFTPSAANSPLMPVSVDDSALLVKASKSSKLSRVSSVKKKDEMKSINNNVARGEENTSNFLLSDTLLPSMPASTDKHFLSFRRSKSKKFSHESSLKKKDEISSMGNNVTIGSFQEANNSCTLHSDDLLSGGKSPKLENGKLSDGKSNFFKNTAEVLPPVDQFASSVQSPMSTTINHKASAKKDEERSKAGIIGEKNDSNTAHFVSGSMVDVPPKKDEQIFIPEKWGDDCFVIPSSENNDVGDILLENMSLSQADSSEARSSAVTSIRRSSYEQGSPQNRVTEQVPWSAQINSSEIENVTGDVVRENDSYKPSTPSPPPRVQARITNYVASSVESSSRTLGNHSLLKDDDCVNPGSPPASERRRALSRTSPSRSFGCSSFFDRDLRKSYKDEAKGANKKTKGDEDQFARVGKCGWDCLKLDVKPAFNKAALKGKSVRTIKPKETAQDRQKTDHNELKCEENNKVLALANGRERKGDKSDTVLIKIGISEKRSNSSGRKGEKLQRNGGTTSILVGLNSKQNSNGTTAVLNDVKEEVNDGEIDRKADEFIAKFKEQIRLQKVAPASTSSRRNKNSL